MVSANDKALPSLPGPTIAICGLAGIAAALRTRRRRARDPETYGSSGGIVYTGIQVGCAGMLLLGGIGLMILSIIFRK